MERDNAKQAAGLRWVALGWVRFNVPQNTGSVVSPGGDANGDAENEGPENAWLEDDGPTDQIAKVENGGPGKWRTCVDWNLRDWKMQNLENKITELGHFSDGLLRRAQMNGGERSMFRHRFSSVSSIDMPRFGLLFAQIPLDLSCRRPGLLPGQRLFYLSKTCHRLGIWAICRHLNWHV